MASQFRGKKNNYIRYKRTSLSLFNFIDSTAIFIVLSLRMYMIFLFECGAKYKLQRIVRTKKINSITLFVFANSFFWSIQQHVRAFRLDHWYDFDCNWTEWWYFAKQTQLRLNSGGSEQNCIRKLEQKANLVGKEKKSRKKYFWWKVKWNGKSLVIHLGVVCFNSKFVCNQILVFFTNVVTFIMLCIAVSSRVKYKLQQTFYWKM